MTGATRGVGECMARRFAAEGAKIVVAGRNEDRDTKVAETIVDAGGRAIFVPTYVASKPTSRTLVAEASRQYGGIDILANNAAPTSHTAASGYASIADLSTEDFDTALKVGLHGPFWSCKYAIPSRIGRGGGSIVSISSLTSLVGLPGLPAYATTKGGSMP